MQIKTIKSPTDLQRDEYREYHREMNRKFVKIYDFTEEARRIMDNFQKSAEGMGIDGTVSFNGKLLNYQEVWKDWNWINQIHNTFKQYLFPPDTNPDTVGFAYFDQNDLKKLNRLWRRYGLEHLV